MAEYDEEGVDVAAAAQILLSLRNRKLRRWPEWEEAEFDLPPVPEGWPKGRRSALLVRASGAAWLKSLKDPFAQLGSGASSSGEDRAWSPVPVREKAKAARRAELLPCHVAAAAAGSGPSTSGGERARSRPRPRASEKAKVAAAVKEAAAMAASSPETPFDYGVAAGSGASSSGDERLRSSSPTKRKARRRSGSGGPCSGDEGCSSPAKRTRPDLNAGDGVTRATAAVPAAVKAEEPPKIDEENCRDEKGHLLFDLNEDLNMTWEG